MWKYMIVDKAYIPGRKNKFLAYTNSLNIKFYKIKYTYINY